MSYSYAVWKFKDKEEEGIVPANWIRKNIVYYPQGLHNRRLFKECATPQSDWLQLPLVKIKVTGKSFSRTF